MKKIIIIILILLLIISGIYLFYDFNKEEKEPIKEENTSKIEEPIKEKWIDNNPINLGLYKYYGSGKNRTLVTEYSAPWTYHKDISSFEVFFTNENEIPGTRFQNLFKEKYELYQNIEQYKIGYYLEFDLNNQKVKKYVLTPNDTLEYYDYLELYLYDDYHQTPGVWYSHILEEEVNDETLLTSIKLTAGKNIDSITSDITLTTFTYDGDDFESNEYRGISKYTIIVKRTNN